MLGSRRDEGGDKVGRNGERGGGQVEKKESTETRTAEKYYFSSLVSEKLKIKQVEV